MKNLKLNCLNQNELSKIHGGEELKQVYVSTWSDLFNCYVVKCGCGCIYAGKGGSSSESNANANAAQGLFTYPREV